MKKSVRENIEHLIGQYRIMLQAKQKSIDNYIKSNHLIEAHNEQIKVELVKIIILDLENTLK